MPENHTITRGRKSTPKRGRKRGQNSTMQVLPGAATCEPFCTGPCYRPVQKGVEPGALGSPGAAPFCTGP
jgi:hypothetical protein